MFSQLVWRNNTKITFGWRQFYSFSIQKHTRHANAHRRAHRANDDCFALFHSCEVTNWVGSASTHFSPNNFLMRCRWALPWLVWDRAKSQTEIIYASNVFRSIKSIYCSMAILGQMNSVLLWIECRSLKEEVKEKFIILPNAFFFYWKCWWITFLLEAENINACQCFRFESVCHRLADRAGSNSKSEVLIQIYPSSTISIEGEFLNRLRQILWTKKKSQEKLKSIDMKNDDELIRKINEFDGKKEKTNLRQSEKPSQLFEE